MTEYLIKDTTLTSIANAIREKTGETSTMKPAEFPDKIRAIEGGGGQIEAPMPFTRLANPDQLPTSFITGFEWHPNGNRLVVITNGGAWLYNTETVPYTFIEVLQDSDLSRVSDAAYSPDGTRLVIMSDGQNSSDIVARIYNTTTTPYTLIDGLIPSAYSSRSYLGYGSTCAFSPNGDFLCITGDGYVLYDTTYSPYRAIKYTNGIETVSNKPVFDESGKYVYLSSNYPIYTYSMGSLTFTNNYLRLTIADNRTTVYVSNSYGLSNADQIGMSTRSGDKYVIASNMSYLLIYDISSSGALAPASSFRDGTHKWGTSAVNLEKNAIVCLDTNDKPKVCMFVDNGVLFYDLTPDFTGTASALKFSPDRSQLLVGSRSTDGSYEICVYDTHASL